MSKSRYVYPKKNGSESRFVHQSDDPKTLRAIGRKSALSAVRENHALGLPVTYINKSQIIQEGADGQKKVIGHRNIKEKRSTGVSKGDVIRVKKG